MNMKENYTHKNRHKYYLKCHLIFCTKYRRKILLGNLDDDIKAIFQSIADNSDFSIDIMETDLVKRILLEREDFVVRWLFRLLDRRGQSKHCERIYQTTGLVPYIPQAKDLWVLRHII